MGATTEFSATPLASLAGDGIFRHFRTIYRGVNVRRIKEVDAAFDGRLHQLIGPFLANGADDFEHASAVPECHGAEAEGGYLKSCVTECFVAHDVFLSGQYSNLFPGYSALFVDIHKRSGSIRASGRSPKNTPLCVRRLL